MILLCLVLATSHGTEPPSSSYRSVIHDANVDITPVLIDEFQSDSSLRFALLGDWGGMERRGADARFPFTTQSQLVVAEALSQTVRRRGVQFVVSLVRCGKCDFVCELGDHFYQKGVRSVNDSRFHDTFEHVYSQPNLMQLPWYMIAGNHDHEGNVEAQIDYSRLSTRWRFPSEWYTRRFTFGGAGGGGGVAGVEPVSVQIVFMDGSIYHAQFMNAPFALVDKRYVDVVREKTQLAWLERVLAQSKADWLVVVCHFPIMSAAEYAGYPSLITNVQPLLERYNVSLYANGHTHTLQHLQHNRVDYAVVGCGAVMNTNRRNWFNIPLGSLRFCHPDARQQNQNQVGVFSVAKRGGGFGVVQIHNRTTMTLDFLNENSDILYSTVVHNRRRKFS